MDNALNLHHIAYPVSALGPGKRLVLWVSGCPLSCKGCITPKLQNPQSGQWIAITRLRRYLLALPMALDGVTFTGGEPFMQAQALAELWTQLSPHRPHWNLLVFSGFTLAQLRAYKPVHGLDYTGVQSLLAQTDLLIAGPYIERATQNPATAPLVASANQEIHELSAKAPAMKMALTALPATNLGFTQAAEAWLVGIVDPLHRQVLHQQLGCQ